MWYEILPTFGIIVTFMALPSYAMYGINKLVLKNPYRRDMEEPLDRMYYRRDFRIAPSPYIMNGLESVPDEDETTNTE